MKITKKDNFTILVPTEKEFLCSIEDKSRFDRETEEESKKPEEYRQEIAPIYKFKEAYIPESRTIEDCEKEFIEIDRTMDKSRLVTKTM